MSVLPKLHNFYFTAILPELALPRMHTGGIREPKEWLSKPDDSVDTFCVAVALALHVSVQGNISIISGTRIETCVKA